MAGRVVPICRTGRPGRVSPANRDDDGRHGRRPARRRVGRREPGSVLGPPGRRRELRHRHRVPLPAPRDRSDRARRHAHAPRRTTAADALPLLARLHAPTRPTRSAAGSRSSPRRRPTSCPNRCTASPSPASSSATPGRSRTARRCSGRCASSGLQASTWSSRCRTSPSSRCSTPGTVKGTRNYWTADFYDGSPRRRGRRARRARDETGVAR